MMILLFAGSVSSCQPIQPAVGTLPPVDASASVRALQLEEARDGQEVLRIARSLVGQDLEAAAKVAQWPQPDAQADQLDGGSIARAPDSQVAGKLERATSNRIIIRDDSGFAYTLQASEATQVTANGRPARLTDFKQGTDVRAHFFWKGKERVATAVDVLGAGEGPDGGFLEQPSGS